jgi:hypothetical protein
MDEGSLTRADIKKTFVYEEAKCVGDDLQAMKSLFLNIVIARQLLE